MAKASIRRMNKYDNLLYPAHFHKSNVRLIDVKFMKMLTFYHNVQFLSGWWLGAYIKNVIAQSCSCPTSKNKVRKIV